MWRASLFAVVLGLTGLASAAGFRHPAMPLNRTDLEFLKAHKEEAPWRTGWDLLRRHGTAQPTYVPPRPVETVERWPGRGKDNWPWKIAMGAAWNQARMWYFTGDERHARIARDILVGWATTQKAFDGYEACLDIGEHVYYFCGAADILRGCWSGWSEADTAVVQKWMKEVILPATGYPYKIMGPANKGGLEMAGAFGVAVFCDDIPLFKELVHVFVRDRVACLDGFLPTGQGHEAGRDMGHSYGGLLSCTYICELAWKQGVDMYSILDERMLAAGEYYAAQNLGIAVPFVSHGNTDGIYTKPCDGGWAHGRRGMTWLTTAYRFRLGRQTPWMDLKRAVSYEDVDSWCCWLPEDRSRARPYLLQDLRGGDPGKEFAVFSLGVTGPSAACKDGAWTLSCTGGDLWRHPQERGGDACLFLGALRTNRNVSVTFRVDGLESKNPRAKVAAMFRSSAERNAPYKAWCAVLPPEVSEMEYFYSGWSGMRGGRNWEKGVSRFPDRFPVWLRLERYGEWVYTSWSPDGTSWTARGCGSYADLPDRLYYGIALASGSSATASARVSCVAVTGTAPDDVREAPAAPLALFTGGNAQGMTVRWAASARADRYRVERAFKGGPWKTIGTTTELVWNDPATRSPGASYRVTALNAHGAATSSAVEGRYVPKTPVEKLVLGGRDVLTVTPPVVFRRSPLTDGARIVFAVDSSIWGSRKSVGLARFLEGDLPKASRFGFVDADAVPSAEIYVDAATRTVRARRP